MKYSKSISMLLLLLPIEAMAQFAWYGANGKAQVVTDLGNGTHTEGIWFSFDDKNDRGESSIVFLDSRGDTPTDQDVKTYGGIKGEITLKYGNSMYTRAGLGFNVVGEKEPWVPEEGDASAWGGISIGYKSDRMITVELGLPAEIDHAIGYANPQYYLSARNTETFVRIPWSSFKQPDWAPSYCDRITGPEAAEKLVALKFYMAGDEGTYSFLITKVGSYDMAEMPPVTSGCSSLNADIDDNGGWYTLSGVQLRNQPTDRGVYIHNGQKVVVK